MKQLKNSDLLENTIVIYLSDNGPNGNRWNGEMKGRKGSTDEGGVRSPMIINWPVKFPKERSLKKLPVELTSSHIKKLNWHRISTQKST